MYEYWCFQIRYEPPTISFEVSIHYLWLSHNKVQFSLVESWKKKLKTIVFKEKDFGDSKISPLSTKLCLALVEISSSKNSIIYKRGQASSINVR